MSERKTAAGGGIGFGGLLTVLFIGLKLTGHIAWSWWWVLSPLWLPWAIGVAAAVAWLAAAAVIVWVRSMRRRP